MTQRIQSDEGPRVGLQQRLGLLPRVDQPVLRQRREQLALGRAAGDVLRRGGTRPPAAAAEEHQGQGERRPPASGAQRVPR
ncbi:MAG: hypothetical protein IPG96_20560 [Proteobacteria bacterium]|nr:hypothetical protein [Pseudomonadota bacterium]